MKRGCLGCFVTGLVILVFIITLLRPPGIRYMERQFQRNKEELTIVRDFIFSLDFESVSIWNPFRDEASEMFVGLEYGRIPINDEKALRAIRVLFRRGFRSIEKRDNGISFLRWATLDHGRGIVYSIDGETPGEAAIHFLTEIEPLSEKGWYFYIDDFNQWRLRNRGM